MVFIASTIITVCPFFILSPTSTNFLAPGSAAKYAVPMIGDLTLIPSLSLEDFRTVLFGGTTALVFTCSIPFSSLGNFYSYLTILIL